MQRVIAAGGNTCGPASIDQDRVMARIARPIACRQAEAASLGRGWPREFGGAGAAAHRAQARGRLVDTGLGAFVCFAADQGKLEAENRAVSGMGQSISDIQSAGVRDSEKAQ